MRDQPVQQAPPVQRLRIRYAKRGRLRFTSHRDFARAFERALVRAGVPMAYSSGFTPHPRISYAGAAPTGSASEAEYLEIGLAARVDPDQVRTRLAAALPDGLDVVDVVESPGDALAYLLQASRWSVDLGVAGPEASAAVEAFLAQESAHVERMTKKGLRDVDCRAAVVRLTVHPGDRGCRLELVLRHMVPAVRPEDVLHALTQHCGLRLAAGPLLTRCQQGPLDPVTGEVLDPLDRRR